MLPPGASTTGRNADRLYQARAWSAFNFAPPRPAVPELPELEPTEEEARRLRDLIRGLPGAGPERPPRQRLPENLVSTHIQLHARAAIGARAAASRGPFGAPWRVTGGYIQQDNTAAGTGFALTASPYDASNTIDSVVGAQLIDFNSVGTVAPPEAGYFQESDISQTSPKPIFPRGQIMPAGSFATLWVSATLAAVSHAAAAILTIEELRGVEISPGPDLELVLNRLRQRVAPAPRPRAATAGAPAAVRVSGPGFSRIIPWTYLAPALQREYIVNLVNGKPTPGIVPL